MSTNDQNQRIRAWLEKLLGQPFDSLPFKIPDWAKYLTADPYGAIDAHEVMPCPQTWHGDREDCPLWTSDEWWQDQGREECLYDSPKPTKCDYVWDALFDLTSPPQ